METLEPFVWIKHKYAAPKQRGRYAGSSNAAAQKKKHRKDAKAPKPTFKTIMVLDPLKGKTTWVREPI